jgi:hypothetical protein
MRLGLGIALAVLLLASPTFAAVIPVNNASFEEPDLTGGGPTWTNDLVDWTQLPAAGDAFIEYIPGPPLFASDGVQHLGTAQGAEVYQDTGVGLAADSVYTLRVDIGNRNDSFTEAGNASTIGLYAGASALDGGTPLATTSFDANFLLDGTFAGPLTLDYVSNGSPPSGNIFISLQSTGANRSHFDNVRLDVVPEPSSITLVFLALLGVVRLRRK